MKKIFTIIFSLFISSNLFARFRGIDNQWMVIGGRGAINSTWLYNANQWNDKGLRFTPSWGGSGGLMIGVHYTSWGAVHIEGLYSTFNQKMVSTIDSMQWKREQHLKYIQVPILARFDFKNFKYVETGIQISSLLSAQESFYLSDTSHLNYSGKNIKSNFEKSNLALVFGWGGAIWGTGGLMIRCGFRFTYGLSDIISASGGKGNDYYKLSDAAAPPQSYTKTTPMSVGFNITLDYDLGWFMSSSCHRGYKFFLFNH